jgi:hypothetical protein
MMVIEGWDGKEVRSEVGGIMEEEDTRWDSLSVRLRRLRALLFLYIVAMTIDRAIL